MVNGLESGGVQQVCVGLRSKVTTSRKDTLSGGGCLSVGSIAYNDEKNVFKGYSSFLKGSMILVEFADPRRQER